MPVERPLSIAQLNLAPYAAHPGAWVDRVARLLFTAAVLFLVAYAFGIILVTTSGEMGGSARQVDFVAFWGAGKLALAGDPVAAFDPAAHKAAQSLPLDALPGDMLWLYPPGLQLIFVPFALAPYWLAWLLWGALSLTAFLCATWRMAAPVPIGQTVLVAAPMVVSAVTYGQITLLWTAVLLCAFHQIVSGRMLIAGILIGTLSVKPQLGVLLPIFMIAAGRWDVLIGAVIGTALTHGLPTLVVGIEYWAAFFERMRAVTGALDFGGMPHPLMVTPYAFLRMFDLAHSSALAVQLVLSALIALGVFLTWRRFEANPNLALGMLLIAIPIATPYAFYYELALAVPGAVFMVRGGYGANALEWALMGLAVMGPVLLFPVTELSPVFAPVLVLLFLHGFLRFRQTAAAAEAVNQARA